MCTTIMVKTVKLGASDNQVFVVPKEVADWSQTVKNMVEDLADADEDTGEIVPLPNVSSKVLARVIEYCTYHVEADRKTEGDKPSKTEAEVAAWDAVFIGDFDQTMLFDIVLAANYLNIKSLLDLSCQRIASMMKGKTADQIREMFNIKNDFTPEEEEEVRRENQWAFD